MIKLTDKFDISHCKAIPIYNPFASKMISVFNTEQKICDVLVYEQLDDHDKVNAFILNASSDVTILANESSDLNEICDFLSFTSYSSVLSNVPLRLEAFEKSGYILKYSNLKNERKMTAAKLTDDLEKIYYLLSRNFSEMTDYSKWIADMSHRLRHKSAAVIGLKKDDEFVSCALCSYICEDSCVINGVCTDEKYRNNSFASECLEKAVSYLHEAGIKNIFVLCENKLTDFYIKNGFEKNGEWYEYLRKI
ncbi:MAG: GNAT family N-acetyltransferase [Clostridia bacterium]|nr:GNAT family N-acetyltransferase [Clostridia bacterium]